ncbi:MAG TPA: hypothetical protein P5248_08060, partial [Bacteroidales bacterium]|nr:hypothetical protein [Bacteroidales bacterium]
MGIRSKTRQRYKKYFPAWHQVFLQPNDAPCRSYCSSFAISTAGGRIHPPGAVVYDECLILFNERSVFDHERK